LHRIALPVVSEWYQQRPCCVTTVLPRSMHPKAVQHLDGHKSIQLTVKLLLALGAEYEQDIPEGMDEASGWRRRLPAGAKPRRKRA
jgi:hypothetical protein